MNAKRYAAAPIIVTATNQESKKKYDRATKLADEVMAHMQRMCYNSYGKWSDEDYAIYRTLGTRFHLLMAISYTAHADIVKGASCKTESRRRAHNHLNAYKIGCIHDRNFDELRTAKFSNFWSRHIDEVPADWRTRMVERIEEERSRGN